MNYIYYYYFKIMGKNTGDGFRKGQTKDRKQIYNEKTKQYIKVNTETGRFMSSKDTPYKGVSIRNNNKKSLSNKN